MSTTSRSGSLTPKTLNFSSVFDSSVTRV